VPLVGQLPPIRGGGGAVTELLLIVTEMSLLDRDGVLFHVPWLLATRLDEDFGVPSTAELGARKD
jgi:hypothetical protein